MGSLLSGLTAFAIFGSWVWGAIIVGVVLIALFVSEVEEEGSIAFIAVLAFAVLNYFIDDLFLLFSIFSINAT